MSHRLILFNQQQNHLETYREMFCQSLGKMWLFCSLAALEITRPFMMQVVRGSRTDPEGCAWSKVPEIPLKCPCLCLAGHL